MASPRAAALPRGSSIGGGDSLDDFPHLQQSLSKVQIVKETRRLRIMCISAPEGGHLVPVANVAVALAQRKHKVQLVTCDLARAKMEGLCRRAGCEFVGVAKQVAAGDSGTGRAAELKDADKMAAMFMYYNDTMHGEVLAQVKAFRPDIVVGDFITPCSWEIPDELGIPNVINIPGPLAFFGAVTPGALVWQRLVGRLTLPREEAEGMARVYAGILHIFFSRPLLVHSFFGLDAPVALPPHITVTGSTAPRLGAGTSETSLPELNHWLKHVRAEGLKVVYVTMGSMQVLTASQVQALCNGVLDVPGCACLWSLKEDQQKFLPGGGVQGLPKHFFVNKWLPQAEALQLPEVAVVVTHCGWGGLNETINAGKPIVATPFRADQPLNAKVAKSRGLCEVLDTSKLAARDVSQAIAKVVGDPAYARCAKDMQAALLRTGGAEKCAETVELLANGYSEVLPRSSPTLLEGFWQRCRPALLTAAGAAAAVLAYRTALASGRLLPPSRR